MELDEAVIEYRIPKELHLKFIRGFADMDTLDFELMTES